ncbi:hypothetical protein EDC96DRAFT_241259 [Choanephora cucurbitarum]|nr:hypothetical protein EDC96DRAFT_241259 [Choanephora cucurbitarum]
MLETNNPYTFGNSTNTTIDNNTTISSNTSSPTSNINHNNSSLTSTPILTPPVPISTPPPQPVSTPTPNTNNNNNNNNNNMPPPHNLPSSPTLSGRTDHTRPIQHANYYPTYPREEEYYHHSKHPNGRHQEEEGGGGHYPPVYYKSTNNKLNKTYDYMRPPPPPPPPLMHVYHPTQLKKESSPNQQEEEDWYDHPKTIAQKGNDPLYGAIESRFPTEYRRELKEAHQDTHTFYLDNIRDLEAMRQKMIEDGQLFREYQKQVTENQFRLEIYQAEEEYTAETQEIREKLFTVLEEKRRKLKEDKDNCDLAYDLVMDTQARLHKRNLRKRGPENPDSKSNKKKHLNGPSLVFKLKDDDILSDMQAMRNGITSSITTPTSSPLVNALKKSTSLHKKKQ